MDLPCDLAIPLLGLYRRECDSGYYKGTCTPMFIAALFTIAKLWKWTKNRFFKMCYLCTIVFCSATKKNEFFSFRSKCTELENITLSEVSQAHKAKNRMFSLICRL
jgi:hypothetical protein